MITFRLSSVAGGVVSNILLSQMWKATGQAGMVYSKEQMPNSARGRGISTWAAGGSEVDPRTIEIRHATIMARMKRHRVGVDLSTLNCDCGLKVAKLVPIPASKR